MLFSYSSASVTQQCHTDFLNNDSLKNSIISCTKSHYWVIRYYCVVMRLYFFLVSEPSFLSAWLLWSSPSGGTGKMCRLVNSWAPTLDLWPNPAACDVWLWGVSHPVLPRMHGVPSVPILYRQDGQILLAFLLYVDLNVSRLLNPWFLLKKLHYYFFPFRPFSKSGLC